MRALLTTSIVVSSAYLFLLLAQHAAGPFSIVLKVTATGLLVAVAALAHHRRKLLIFALVFSVAGDLLLELRRIGSLGPEQVFLFGLVSFLTAHIFYIAMFFTSRSTTPIHRARIIACIAALCAAAISMIVLWPGLADMRIPVFAYSLVLVTMVITAQMSRFNEEVAIGALLFLASDTTLAMCVFGHWFPFGRPLIWITYYGAQLLILVGVTSSQRSAAATA